MIVNTGAWSLLAKACGAANLFVSVPFVLQALGPEQFGAWATLAALTAFAGFLDFGFGNGTMNLVAGARGRNDDDEIGRVLHEGSRALWLISGCVALVACLSWLLVPWHMLLGLPDSLSGEARGSAAVVLAVIVAGIPLNLAARVQLGLGHGDRAFRWQALGQLLTLCVVLLCARPDSSLTLLTAAAVATPLTAALANTLELRSFSTEGSRVRDAAIAGRIRREGILFFVLQLASALAFLSDLPLISALRGSAEAGNYAIVQRLFSIIPMGLALLWVPLWPTYRQALASRDHAWLIKTLRMSIVLACLLAAFTGLVLALGFDHIADAWLDRPLAVSGWLLAGFAVWYVLDAFGNGIAAFLNAASIMRYQVIVASCFAILCFGGKAYAISKYGMEAAPWATITTYILVSLLPTVLLRERLISQALAKRY